MLKVTHCLRLARDDNQEARQLRRSVATVYATAWRLGEQRSVERRRLRAGDAGYGGPQPTVFGVLLDGSRGPFR